MQRNGRFVSPGRSLVLAVVILAMFVASHAALAQGTSGMLPDPISTEEMDQYAALLSLSSQQRQAIEPMHSSYLEQFARLRSDEIDDFLAQTRDLRRSLFNPDNGDQVEKATRDHKRIMSRIASLDDQLFNQVQSVLSDEQIAQLPRARMARERERYTTDATRFATAMNPAVRIDLSELARDTDLAGNDRQAIDPVLRRYEDQLTDMLRSLHGVSSGMFERVTTSVRETVGEVDRSDPEQMRAMFDALRNAWETASIDVTEQSMKVSDLNRSTIDTLAPLMSPDGGRSLWQRFARLAYPQAFRNGSAADRRINAALALDDLNDDIRAAILELRDSFDSRYSAIARQLMDVIDDQRRERGTGFGFGRNDNDNDNNPNRARQEELRNRLATLEEETLEALNGLLSAEVVAALEGKGDSDSGNVGSGQFTFVTVDGGGGVGTFQGTVELETSQRNMPTDPYIAEPISTSDLEYYTQTLAIDEQVGAIVQSLYDEYRQTYRAISEEHIQPLAEMAREMWSFGRGRGRGDRQVEGPDLADVDRMFAMRREAMAAILAADNEFFDGVALLLSDDDTTNARMDRVRQSRLRDVYNRGETGPGNVFIGGGRGSFRARLTQSEEERVDLTRALRDLEFDDEQTPVVEDVLNTYSRAMTDALQAQYEASISFAEAMQRAMIQMMQARREAERAAGEGERRRIRIDGGQMEAVEEQFGRQRRDTTQQVVDLNRRTVEQLRSLLPESLGRQVRDAYYTEAYPAIYSDRTAATAQLDGALALPDLTPDQRGDLLDIAADYRGQYDQLNLEMVRTQIEQTANDSDDADNSDDQRGRRGRDWQRLQELRNEIERLQFSRDELNEKTRRRIKAVLNERQVAQVRGLSHDADES